MVSIGMKPSMSWVKLVTGEAGNIYIFWVGGQVAKVSVLEDTPTDGLPNGDRHVVETLDGIISEQFKIVGNLGDHVKNVVDPLDDCLYQTPEEK
jgi:hypothetical protein